MPNPISMITAKTLGGLPALLAAEAGERRLASAWEQAGLHPALLHVLDQEFYIPQLGLLRFLEAGGRELGIASLGLAAVGTVSVADYGIWGAYVLSAPTLRASLQRAICAYYIHSSGDFLQINEGPDGARFVYRSAVADAHGYENISFVGAAVMRSLVRHYAGAGWRPEKLALDVAPPRSSSVVEEAFGTPLQFGVPHLTFLVPSNLLDLPNPHRKRSPTITLADVVRARGRGVPRTVPEIVAETVRLQLRDGLPSIEDAARCLGYSVRSMQRRLIAEGTSFRDIANAVTAERTAELLREPVLSVTAIAAELGYSSPAHLARAFRQATGVSPGDYRASLVRTDRRPATLGTPTSDARHSDWDE